jgi:ubiquinone biosynthesis UbiH/UbiF/VisC/COQ6 family hydroxylase
LQAEAAALAPRAGDVRTYALNAGSRELLLDLKVWPALPADAVTPVHDMWVQGDASAPPGAGLRFSAYEQRSQALAWIVDAAELDRALAAALSFAAGVEIVDRPLPAELLVVAEGRDAATRAQLGVQMQRHAYGQTAIAARLVADLPHAATARQWFGSPQVLALLPFDRPQPGRSYGLVWSLPEAQAHELMAADAAGFEAALHAATGGAAGTLMLAGERAAWPLQAGRAEPLCGPGWVLVGDAAHLVHPLAGQGLNLGLADVASLCRVLAARAPHEGIGDEAVLRRHARERAAPTLAMTLAIDGLHQLFAHRSPLLRSLRNHGLAAVGAIGPLKRLLAQQAARS